MPTQFKLIASFSISLITLLLPAVTHAFCSTRILSTTPDEQFSIQSNGSVVVDKKSGLMWKRCAEGLSGSNCEQLSPSNHAGTYTNHGQTVFTFGQALSFAANHQYSGYSDWRLPNVKELRSIVDERCHDPAINPNVFPNTGHAIVYWTNTPSLSARTGGASWSVGFGDGATLTKFIAHSNFVRLVRDVD